mmetsp:Transcript_3267/g.7415  ORF Transcript_3267/g.7415 Transcript_3267/m.7415 type:complete len:199 (-) Transcript_3267:863-1459(-)
MYVAISPSKECPSEGSEYVCLSVCCCGGLTHRSIYPSIHPSLSSPSVCAVLGTRQPHPRPCRLTHPNAITLTTSGSIHARLLSSKENKTKQYNTATTEPERKKHRRERKTKNRTKRNKRCVLRTHRKHWRERKTAASQDHTKAKTYEKKDGRLQGAVGMKGKKNQTDRPLQKQNREASKGRERKERGERKSPRLAGGW